MRRLNIVKKATGAEIEVDGVITLRKGETIKYIIGELYYNK